MANFTPDDERISDLTGGSLSPSQVRNCKTARLAPDRLLSESDWWPALAQLLGDGKSFGPGRFDLAVLEMARNKHGGCNRLRSALRRRLPLKPQPNEEVFDDADKLVEAAVDDPSPLVRHMHDMAGNVAEAEVGIYYDKADAPGEVQDLVLRTALLPVAQAATGEPIEAGDCLDLLDVVSGSLPRDLETGEAYVAPEEIPEAIALSIQVGKGVQAWVEDSSLADLARDVAAGAEFFDAFTVLGLFGDVSKINDEERWRLTLPYAVAAQSIAELGATTIRQIFGQSLPLPSLAELAADFRAAHPETRSVRVTPRLPTLPFT
jgi:hypothetical protein